MGDSGSRPFLSPPEEPIVLQPIRTSQRRVIVPLLLCAGMLVIPLVALATSGTPGGTVRVAAKRGAEVHMAPVSLAAMQPAAEAPPVAVVTEAPQVTVQAAAEANATAATSIAPSPRVVTTASAASVSRVTAAPSTTAPRPAPTSPPTTASPPPPAPRTTAAPQHSQSGPASYYDQAPNGTCAHPTLPFGTVVSIVDTDNGNTASCTVEDRGPYAGGRIIDLARDVFSRLAPISQGVINVRISW